MAPAPKFKFQENEKVLCFHGPLLYEAKCIKAQVSSRIPVIDIRPCTNRYCFIIILLVSNVKLAALVCIDLCSMENCYLHLLKKLRASEKNIQVPPGQDRRSRQNSCVCVDGRGVRW